MLITNDQRGPENRPVESAAYGQVIDSIVRLSRRRGARLLASDSADEHI
jgi:hypothetical protein